MTLPRWRIGFRATVLRAVPAVVLALSSVMLAAPEAHAAVTTTFTAGVLTITGDGGNDNITVSRTLGGEFRLDHQPIGGGPTVTNTDRIHISMGSGDDIVVIDFKHGGFEPGLTPEASGRSEIEVDVAGGGGFDQFVLFGTRSNDRMTLGAHGLNWDEDGDVDLTVGGFESTGFLMSDGDDTFDGSGDAVTGAAFPRKLLLEGGDGDDTLIAGSGPSLMNGREGRDRLVGGPAADSMGGGGQGDVFTGGGGHDLFAGGSGNDFLVEQAVGDLTLTDGRLVGASGTDRLNSIQGALLRGDAGPNTFDASGFRHPVTLVGLGGDDVLTGGPLADRLLGGLGDDRLFGRDGRDRLGGGPGSDHGDGGPGTDVCTGIEVPTSCP